MKEKRGKTHSVRRYMMKTLVIYYSYTGKTKKLAEETAKKENADIIEVKEKKKPSKVKAYVLGSFAARGQKEANLLPYDCDFSAYDKIIIAIPIWAAFPAPPFNNIVKALPSGKDVDLIMTSGSGSSSRTAEQTKKLVEDRGCRVIKYLDVKT